MSTKIAILFSYRLLLHPLRSYPGPVLAKLSDVYGGIHAGSMSLHVTTREDHLKYGIPNQEILYSETSLT